MASKKQLPTNNGNYGALTWNKTMDDALVDALMQEFEKGNEVNGIFTSLSYNNVTVELVRLFGDKIDKVKLQHRWKTLKRNYNEYNENFKGGMSGFSWNSTTQLWDAESEVWDALIDGGYGA